MCTIIYINTVGDSTVFFLDLLIFFFPHLTMGEIGNLIVGRSVVCVIIILILIII